MKRLMIGLAAATLLSTLPLAAQAEDRGGRHGFSRAPSHAPAYSRAHRAAPRHYQPRRHFTPPRSYGHYRPYRGYGYRAHPGWHRHYSVPRHGYFRARPYGYRYWR